MSQTMELFSLNALMAFASIDLLNAIHSAIHSAIFASTFLTVSLNTAVLFCFASLSFFEVWPLKGTWIMVI